MSKDNSIYNTFARPDITFVRGEGVRLFTDKGEEYIDFAAGIAVNSLGHVHPHLVKTLTEQAEKLWHVSNLFEIPDQTRLAERLVEATFAEKVFFTNSGTEALECAIKTARHYHYDRGDEERINIITFEGAFHGRTLATIAAGGQEKYLEGFGPKAPGFIQVPFGDWDALLEVVNDKTAALLIEPIQGEGGLRPVPYNELRDMRKLCDDNGILLIYDEVQTGVGRTGKLFAHEWANLEGQSAAPDIMAVAKGIGGGFPLGACLATEAAARSMGLGTHGTTFGGNPLAMAVGNAVLDVVLEDGFLIEVQQKAQIFNQKLGALVDAYPQYIKGIRGEGLMLGIECEASNLAIKDAFLEAKLLTVPAGANVLRLLPPLTLSEDDVNEGIKRMDEGLAALAAKDK
jgi:acetylornithine/N-succinyldiaminopimelate aminotransferase